LFPTGGLSKSRFWSIHRRRLKGAANCIAAL